MPSAATLMQHRGLLSLLLLLLLLLMLPADSLGQRNRHRQKRRWKHLPEHQLPTAECSKEFHDAQSKWLQSELVVRATWLASDESTPTDSGAYNISLTVAQQLKPWRQNLEGRRIKIGTFNRTRVRDQRARQRQTCVPCDLRRRRVGYVFFLTATPQPGYFQLAFLPMHFKQRLKKKFDRVQCNEMRACRVETTICARPPELVKQLRKRIQRNGGSGGMRIRLRLVCRASGLPRPRPLWLRNGEPIKLGRGVVAQFRTRKNIVSSRLVLKNAAPEDAGNYTCVFRNIKGSVSSGIIISGEEFSSMGQQTSTAATPTYLCNATYCLNGGTCVINRITNMRSCQCPPEYMGFFCESINIEYMYREQIKRNLMRSLAVAGASETGLPATTIVAAVALVALFVVLLAICCMVVDIRRRLDRKHWTDVAGKLGQDDEEMDSRLASTLRSRPLAPTLLDATTMTESPPPPPPVPPHSQHPPIHPQQQADRQLNSLNTRPELSVTLSNGPSAIAVLSGMAREPRHATAPLTYTYRSPGSPTGQPAEFRIQPVFNYTADSQDGADEHGEAIDLLKEFRQLELLQKQQEQQEKQKEQQQQKQQQQQQQQQPQQAQPQPTKQMQKKPSVKRPLPFPGHGTPSTTGSSSSSRQ